ncbi:unnamed protein product [Penicillium camemberti]|uniref:Str. FM013 n=1 Tax=Penicillium camemberti (strain FM 013) TaxID=1429867 RepID=A0A0G4P3V5_PENC3|nr:unnamed protein product [Penicillium camemberti]
MNLKTRKTATTPRGTGRPPSVQIVERDRTRETVVPVAIAAIEDMLGFARRFVKNARTSDIRGDTVDSLHGLHRKAGVPNHSRLMLNNVHITTNIIAAERKAPVAPDTSLFDRVQRIPTGPRSNIPNTRSAPTKPTYVQPAFARPAFAPSALSQPVFGQTAFS